MTQLGRTVACLALLLVSSSAFAANDLAGVGELIFAGRGKEARAQLVNAHASALARSDGSREAVALLLLGIADYSLEDVSSARTHLDSAATKFTVLKDDFSAWLALWTLSELEKGQGQYDKAIAVHERALALLRNAASPQSKFSLDTMQILGPVFGMPTEALSPLAQFPELVKPIMLQFAEVVSHDAYGHALVEAGHLKKAEQQLTTATESAAMFGGLFDSSISVHMGDLRRRQWRLEDARTSYVKALDGVKNMPAGLMRDAWVEVQVLGRLAELELLTGRTDEALVWNDRALKLVRGSGNRKREAALLQDRATLLQNGGRTQAALAVFDQALKLAVQEGDVFRVATIHADLGALYFFQGDYLAALQHLQKAIELLQTLNLPYVEAPVWTLLAEVHLMLDSQDSASFALDNARVLAEKSGFKLAGALVDTLAVAQKFSSGKSTATEMDAAFQAWWELPEAKGLMFNDEALQVLRESMLLGESTSSPNPDRVATAGPQFLKWMALMLRGKVALDRGEYESARTHWQAALDANPSRDHRAGLLALIGASYWREAKSGDAIRYFGQAATMLEASAADVKVEELMAGYLGTNRRMYYDLLIEMLVRQGRTEEAFAQAERARARAFLQLVGNHRFNAARGADAKLVGEAEMLRTQIVQRERLAKNVQRAEAEQIEVDLEGLRQRYRTLMIRVKVSNPEYASLTNVEPLEIEEVRARLPAATTLISYYASPNQVHAWVMDAAKSQYVLLPVDGAEMKRIVCWAQRFVPPDESRGADPLPPGCADAATAEQAFAKLIAPLQTHIRNAKLIIVPHGVLHYVPFAALRDSESERYLIEENTIILAPSASALRFLREKETPVEGRALVLGDPDSPLPFLRKLPFANGEALSVAETLGTKAHVGAAACETLLYGLGGKVDLVHLAAHGIYDPANPLFSRIALTADEKNDGSLTVQEILTSVDLQGVNLVVLSACRSASGSRSGGDEVVGLTRALLYAGTPGVLSTLWNINDAASALLMNEFYRRLALGDGVADALREAQLMMLRSEPHGDPRYWAAFTLHGDPQGRWKVAE